MSRSALAVCVLAALAGRVYAQSMPPTAGAPVPAAPAAPVPEPPPVETVPAPDADVDPLAAVEVEGKGDKKHKGDKGKGDKKHKGDHDAATSADGADHAGSDPEAEASPADAPATPAIEISGRVFARFTAYKDSLNDWLGLVSVPSARIGVTYRWKDRLVAKVSLEARGSLRDAYVDVALTPCLHLRGGRFKVPASSIERASAWTLPTIDRPLLSNVLSGGLGIVGRHNGVQLTWEYDAGVHPKVEVSLAQSVDTAGNSDVPFRLSADQGGIMATVRAEIEPAKDLHLGAFAQNRQVLYDIAGAVGLERYWAGGVDLEAEAGGFRIWADAIAGTSHFGVRLSKDPITPFVSGQVIAAWRQGGRAKGKKFIEPYLAAVYLNPNAQLRGDLVTQLVGGVGGGRWKRWRGQVQAAFQNAEAKRAAGLEGVDKSKTAIDINDQITVMAQLGAAF